MSKLTILAVPQSTYGRSVVMAAEEKGAEYDYVTVPPHDNAVYEINPFGKIPAIRHGDVSLGESLAIALYMDSVFDGPRLFPETAEKRAKVVEWVS